MTHTLTIVSHTHWDREWYQPFQEYRIRLVQLVDRLLDLLEQDPEYRHFTLDGQTILLEDYLEVRPAREETLKRYIQEERVLAGPWYILPDEFLVGPEATIRNLMLGDKVSRRFGAKMTIGYVPDCFGHISQLPQILRGFGMDAAVLWRGVGEAPNEFTWAGPDGSEVLTIHLREGYGNAARLPEDKEDFVTQLSRIVEALAPHAASAHLLAMNGTDHTEPMPALSQLMAYANARLPDLDIGHGTLPQFVAAVREAQPSLERVEGELRSAERAHLLPAVYSARIWIKQRNAHCETLLIKWAEPFLALATAHGRETQTRNLSALCWQAWRYLIQNHPHDSICGCSVDAVHKDMDVRFDWVEQIGEEVTRQSLDALAQAVDTTQLGGSPVIVFNPTAGPRTDLVSTRLTLAPDTAAIEVVDADGCSMPCEIVHPATRVSRVMHLDRQELRWTWAEAGQGTIGGEGIQAVEISTAGDTARIDVTTAPYPPAADALERARAEVKALLDREDAERFEVRIHRWHKAETRFVARDLPGHGYRAYAVRPVPPTLERPGSTEGDRLENEFYQVTADPDSGTIAVTDKVTGQVWTGLHRFVDGGDRGDEYNYCPPENDRLVSAPADVRSVRLVEGGPTRQTLEITQVYRIPGGLTEDRTGRSEELVALPLTTRVSLSPGVRRIDLVTMVENRAEDHRLRVHFLTGIATEVSHAEGHFDVLARSLDLPRDTQGWPEQPVPTHHQRTFVDVHEGQMGLLIANKGLPEYEVIPGAEGVTVALTLLRCVGWLSRDDLPCRRGHAGPGLPTPEAQCSGTYRFEYALVPHSGGWERAYGQAHAFNAPLRAVVVPPSGGLLPTALSLVAAEPVHFVLTAIKLPEEGEGLIVRGFNMTDKPQEVTLRLGRTWHRATRVGLDEGFQRELAMEGDRVRFRAAPKQVVTVRFEE